MVFYLEFIDGVHGVSRLWKLFHFPYTVLTAPYVSLTFYVVFSEPRYNNETAETVICMLIGVCVGGTEETSNVIQVIDSA